mmetsp:Transcript_29341/g.63068  ORF Transcript_29341/g.63068 Transcript_29341/m.63068 type:complete len:84 (+) Transcript_29341:2223-2474(+)
MARTGRTQIRCYPTQKRWPFGVGLAKASDPSALYPPLQSALLLAQQQEVQEVEQQRQQRQHAPAMYGLCLFQYSRVLAHGLRP